MAIIFSHSREELSRLCVGEEGQKSPLSCELICEWAGEMKGLPRVLTSLGWFLIDSVGSSPQIPLCPLASYHQHKHCMNIYS